MTRILTPKKIEQYGKTRLLDKDMALSDVDAIWLYNGMFPPSNNTRAFYKELFEKRADDVKKETGIDFSNFRKIIQKNEREPIFYLNGIIFVPQYSGFSREKRYQRMSEEFTSLDDITIDFEVFPKDTGRFRQKNLDYDNFAYDHVIGLFVQEEKHENRRVFDEHDIKDITTVIIGSTKVVEKQTKVIVKGKSPYLDSQLVEINGKKVLNIGYLYGDQAGIIIDKMLKEYYSVAKKQNRNMTVDIYMFGRVGGLEDNMKRHDLICPTGIIDEIDLVQGNNFVYPMNNIMAQESTPKLNLNVDTVIDETYEMLQRAKDGGCSCVEMETRESVESINRARRRYFNKTSPSLNINFGFVGYVSDLPLIGNTVAEELDSDKGEQDALREIINHISVR